MATFAWSLIIVIRYAVVGGWTVGFCFLVFFPPRDDYCASITANVDNVAEVTVGVVQCITNLLLASFCSDASPHVSLLLRIFFASSLSMLIVTVTFEVDG